jgi:hypothetical protein
MVRFSPPTVLRPRANHTDTVAQAVTRGSLIYGNSTPKWDEMVIGSANTVLRSNGTDPSWGAIDHNYISNRTRRVHLPISGFGQSNGTIAALAFSGTYPDRYRYISWPTAPATPPQGWETVWIVPNDYVSGGLIIFFWTAVGLDDNAVVLRAHYLPRADTTSDLETGQEILTAASTTLSKTTIGLGLSTTPTPRAIFDEHYLARSDIGTMSGLVAGDVVNISVDRNVSDASDTYNGEVRLIAVAIDYTADM